MSLVLFVEELQDNQRTFLRKYYTFLGLQNISFRQDYLLPNTISIYIDDILMFNYIGEFDSIAIYEGIRDRVHRWEYYKKELNLFLKHYENIYNKCKVLQ